MLFVLRIFILIDIIVNIWSSVIMQLLNNLEMRNPLDP